MVKVADHLQVCMNECEGRIVFLFVVFYYFISGYLKSALISLKCLSALLCMNFYSAFNPSFFCVFTIVGIEAYCIYILYI